MKILITGASRGIGKYLSEEFQKEGHQVFGTYNSTNIENNNVKLSKVDVSDIEQVTAWVHSVIEKNDEVVVLNCAGTNYNAFAHKAKTELWKKVIDINLIGSFNLINSVLPFMREAGFGRIINFSSIVAQKGIPGTSAYAASKAALWGMTKSIAVENANKGITINNLNLGYFDIGMITDVPEEMLNVIKKSIPKQELGNPENLFNAVKFIIDSDYLTGTSLDINGGLF
jgi:NAD(P)-dependent dehydrogenase (short-subunit alcohol dehydrogenase family)